MVWLADSTSTGNATLDLLLPFLNLGLVIVILIMVVGGKGLVPTWAMSRQDETRLRELAAKDAIIAGLAADKEQLRLGLDGLQAAFREQIVPALVRENQLSADYVELLRRQATTGTP